MARRVPCGSAAERMWSRERYGDDAADDRNVLKTAPIGAAGMLN